MEARRERRKNVLSTDNEEKWSKWISTNNKDYILRVHQIKEYEEKSLLFTETLLLRGEMLKLYPSTTQNITSCSKEVNVEPKKKKQHT